eukprot:UN08106
MSITCNAHMQENTIVVSGLFNTYCKAII